MSHNIYQTPRAQFADNDLSVLTLASRWARLGASIVDNLAVGLIVFPVGYLLGVFDNILEGGGTVGIGVTVLMAITGILTFLFINGYLLNTYGQTVGKKLLGIKIVDSEGNKPTFITLIGLRYIPMWAVSYLPFVGGFAGLIDAIFIFRSDKRCLHDLIAGTRVVEF